MQVLSPMQCIHNIRQRPRQNARVHKPRRLCITHHYSRSHQSYRRRLAIKADAKHKGVIRWYAWLLETQTEVIFAETRQASEFRTVHSMLDSEFRMVFMTFWFIPLPRPMCLSQLANCDIEARSLSCISPEWASSASILNKPMKKTIS